jgi:chromate transporter
MVSLYIGIFLIGISTFGGGAVFIPLLGDLMTVQTRIVSVEEFSRIVAVVNSLPGPTGPKISAYAGYLDSGILGMITAILILIIPSVIIMLMAYRFHEKIKSSKKVKKMNQYIKPIIIAIFLAISVRFIVFTATQLNTILSIVLFLISFLILENTRIKSVYLILSAIVFGNLMYFLL